MLWLMAFAAREVGGLPKHLRRCRWRMPSTTCAQRSSASCKGTLRVDQGVVKQRTQPTAQRRPPPASSRALRSSAHAAKTPKYEPR